MTQAISLSFFWRCMKSLFQRSSKGCIEQNHKSAQFWKAVVCEMQHFLLRKLFVKHHYLGLNKPSKTGRMRRETDLVRHRNKSTFETIDSGSHSGVGGRRGEGEEGGRGDTLKGEVEGEGEGRGGTREEWDWGRREGEGGVGASLSEGRGDEFFLSRALFRVLEDRLRGNEGWKKEKLEEGEIGEEIL